MLAVDVKMTDHVIDIDVVLLHFLLDEPEPDRIVDRRLLCADHAIFYRVAHLNIERVAKCVTFYFPGFHLEV